MKSKRVSSSLAAAVVCCNVVVDIAESASVRGVVAVDEHHHQPPQHIDEQHHDLHSRRRSLQQQQHDDTPSDPYWWHNSKSNEKDIIYVPLTSSTNVNPDKIQQMMAAQTSDTGGIQHGKSSLEVYSITTNNDPDTSDLPYRQPTKTPTSRPTKLPTVSPTLGPSNSPQQQMVLNSAFVEGGEQGNGIYYPLWSTTFTGCTTSSQPPDEYTSINGDNNIQYLFDDKETCCKSWFNTNYEHCYDEVFNIETYLAGMAYEAAAAAEEESMEQYSSGGGSKNTGGSNDQGDSGGGGPPPASELIIVPLPSDAGTTTTGTTTSSSSPTTSGGTTSPPTTDTLNESNEDGGTTTSTSPISGETSPPVSSPTLILNLTPPPSFTEVEGGVPTTVVQPGTSTPPATPDGSAAADTNPPVVPKPTPDVIAESDTPWPTFTSTAVSPPTSSSSVSPVQVPGTASPVQVPGTASPVQVSGTASPTSVQTDTTASPTSVQTPKPTMGGFELSRQPTTSPIVGGGTLEPTSPWPTLSPVEKPAFEQFIETTSPTVVVVVVGDTNTTAAPDDGGGTGTTESPIVAGSTSSPIVAGSTSSPISDNNTPPPAPASNSTTTGSPTTFVTDEEAGGTTTSPTSMVAKSATIFANSAAAVLPSTSDYSNVNKIVYAQSFEDGSILPTTTISNNADEDEYFKWNIKGNAQWTVTQLDSINESYFTNYNNGSGGNGNSGVHVASIGGYGRYALESSLTLTIGSGSTSSSYAKEYYDDLLKHGAYISFGIQTSVALPMDSLVFKVNDEILNYWHDNGGSSSSNTDGWEVVTAYLPPMTNGLQELSWTYSYFGGQDDTTNRENVVKLDRLVISTTTGDITISDVDLQELNVAEDSTVIPGLLNIHDTTKSSDTAAWQVVQQEDSNTVLKADTRTIIRSNPLNAQSITTYHGSATMSMSIITGPFGGALTFALYSQVHTPIDVLEIALDDRPLLAATTSEETWKEYSIDIPQGYHVVTFTYISNPANLPISVVESMGQPGSSSIDALSYVDNIDPALITPGPSTSPTREPTMSPTPYTMPPQNYCGTSLSTIQETCWMTVDDRPPTCNDDDPVCDIGTYCWGNVECKIPEGMEVYSDSTGSDTTSSSTTAPQNYCGKSLETIKATCASGTLTTCNDDDGPCPVNTYCWGNVTCDPIEEEEEEEDVVQQDTTDEPMASTSDGSSFLDSFFATATTATQDYPSCPDGTSSPQGLPGCCVPDPNFLGDGACDAYAPYNTPECNYDFGDCCTESCNPNSSFKCASKDGDTYGPFGYYCIDPQYSNIDEDNCNAENREWVGDGGCDPEYNTAECGWDGGDCCKETCDEVFAYYECGRDAQPFDCKNPDIIYQADYVP